MPSRAFMAISETWLLLGAGGEEANWPDGNAVSSKFARRYPAPIEIDRLFQATTIREPRHDFTVANMTEAWCLSRPVPKFAQRAIGARPAKSHRSAGRDPSGLRVLLQPWRNETRGFGCPRPLTGFPACSLGRCTLAARALPVRFHGGLFVRTGQCRDLLRGRHGTPLLRPGVSLFDDNGRCRLGLPGCHGGSLGLLRPALRLAA